MHSTMGSPLQNLIKLCEQAVQDGMHPLRVAAAMKVAEDVTTMEEVMANTPQVVQ